MNYDIFKFATKQLKYLGFMQENMCITQCILLKSAGKLLAAPVLKAPMPAAPVLEAPVLAAPVLEAPQC